MGNGNPCESMGERYAHLRMFINDVRQTRLKLGVGPSELNELLSVRATHSNDAVTIYQGNVMLSCSSHFDKAL